MKKTPIGILSFNRPQYLDRVLKSLLDQNSTILHNRDIYLFQDGATNPFSGRRYTSSKIIGENESLFRSYFPGGLIRTSMINLGVALNFDRAELMMFEDSDSSAAIFLEDDFELGHNYLSSLEMMLQMAEQDSRIGYVSAIGDHRLSISEQESRIKEFLPMRQNWAFGLTRRQWRKQRPFVLQYLNLVRQLDYRERPHDKIFDLYSSWGFARMESSQDRAKILSCVMTEGVRLSSVACLGRYIGAVGLHSDEQMFKESGFADTQVFPFPLTDFETLTSDNFRRIYNEQRAMVEVRWPEIKVNASPLSVTSRSEGALALSFGFHPAEDWGAWSSADTSELSMYLPTQAFDGTHRLLLRVRHYLPSSHKEATVMFHVNGVWAASIELSGEFTEVELMLPAVNVEISCPSKILMSTKSSYKPIEHNDGDDPRSLGVGVASIALRCC